jgi:glycosyltransferase involved in cell wall biosynthesis
VHVSTRAGGDGRPDEVAVAFVMEQHLGHRTYYENLRAHIDGSRFRTTWIPIDYSHGRWLSRAPLPGSVKSAVSARRVVRSGVASAGADVHVFNTQVPAVLGGRVARSRPYVVITDVTPKQYDRMAAGYGHRADDNGPVARLKDRLNRRLFADARWCVGWSQWVCDSFVADYDVIPQRTRVVPPGVDIRRWQPGPDRDDGVFRILFVGGDFERKGGHVLLRAAAELPGQVELVIVTRSAVPRTDRVRVLSDLEPNDPRLIELFRSSDVLALPSLAETFGIAAAEAAAAGLPVVASDVGGLPEIVAHDVSGLLVPPGSESALISALRALQDGDLRRRMSSAARQRAEERLDAAKNVRQLLDLVTEAASR